MTQLDTTTSTEPVAMPAASRSSMYPGTSCTLDVGWPKRAAW
jgi:hypothetical protein